MGKLDDARNRFLQALAAYDDRYEGDEKEIIVDFLNQLGTRTEAQSELLGELTEEAKRHLRRFGEIRIDLTNRFVHQLGMLNIVGYAAQNTLFRAGLKLPPRDTTGQLTPLQELQLLHKELQAMHANLQIAGVKALDTVYGAEQLCCDLFDAGTALIVMRCATLRTFRQENLLSPLDKVRQHLAEEAEEEFEELVTDEVKEQLLDVLVEYGGDVGELTVEELPVIGLLYRVARVYLKASSAPEKYDIIGGADLMLALLSSLRKQNVLFENFKGRLDASFKDLVTAESSLN